MKKLISIFIILSMLVSFTACSANNTKTEAKKELPQSISQEDWDKYRQEIFLDKVGIKMSYIEMGNPNGPVIIMQHGMTDNNRVWSLSAPYFCQAGYHVYMPDLRGQGYSEQADGFYTIFQYATDIKAFMDAKKIDKAVMMGHSLGSLTMQAFYLMFPEMCEKVVLLASGPVGVETQSTKIYDYVNSLPKDGKISDEFIETWYANSKPVPEDFLNKIKNESKSLSIKAWKNITGGLLVSSLDAMYNYFDTNVPTLMLAGADDPMMTPDRTEKLRKKLYWADYILYEGTGHNIQYEIPEKYSKDVLAWLKGERPETYCENNTTADKIIYGTIYTGNENGDFVEAIAIKGENIVYAGNQVDSEKFIGKKTSIIPLDKDLFVMAGFADAHTHVGTFKAAMKEACNLPDGLTAQQCIETIQKFVDEHPEKPFYFAKGWITSAFDDKGPTAEFLDKVKTEKAIWAMSGDGHSAWANTAMLNYCNITKDTSDPTGGRIERKEDGSPRGCFRDTAINLIQNALPKAKAEDKIPGILEAQDEYAKLGYTEYLEIISNDQANTSLYPVAEGYEQLDKEGKLKIYTQGGFVINSTDDNVKGLVDKVESLIESTKGGMFEVKCIKIYMDGIIESSSAYLEEPYANDETNHGTARWVDEKSLQKLADIISYANEKGIPVHFHTMGDKALSDAIDSIEKAHETLGQKVLDCRNTVTHLALVNDKDYERMKKLNIVANINPWASKDPATFVEKEEIMYLGKERMEREYPFKSFLNNGIHLSFGTDYGASFVFEPINCYRILKTRTTPDCKPANLLGPNERLTAKEAIAAMTSGSAYQMFKEDTFGTLEAGKKASLVILSRNLLEIDDKEIKDTRVLKTMSNGEWVK